MALTMARVGEIRTIMDIRAKDSLKKYLQSLGFMVGVRIQVISDNASGLILQVKGSKIALNKGTANQIIVQ